MKMQANKKVKKKHLSSEKLDVVGYPVLRQVRFICFTHITTLSSFELKPNLTLDACRKKTGLFSD